MSVSQNVTVHMRVQVQGYTNPGRLNSVPYLWVVGMEFASYRLSGTCDLKWLLNLWEICVPLSACLYRKGSLITTSGVAQDLHFGGAFFEPREALGCSDRIIGIFVSFFWANTGILYRLCGDCLPGPPRAGSGPGGK